MYIIDCKKILKILVIFAILISAVIGSRGYFKQVVNIEGKKELPIYSVQRNDKKISISFDTAWGNDDIDKILQVLKDNNVKATFFIVGIWVDKYPEDMKKIYEAGHEIANHSATHPHVIRLGKENFKKQIMDNHKKVKDLLGVDMKLFRSPYGEHNDMIVNSTRDLGYEIIKWDVDTTTQTLLQ